MKNAEKKILVPGFKTSSSPCQFYAGPTWQTLPPINKKNSRTINPARKSSNPGNCKIWHILKGISFFFLIYQRNNFNTRGQRYLPWMLPGKKKSGHQHLPNWVFTLGNFRGRKFPQVQKSELGLDYTHPNPNLLPQTNCRVISWKVEEEKFFFRSCIVAPSWCLLFPDFGTRAGLHSS
jgi:hypothetical protein